MEVFKLIETLSFDQGSIELLRGAQKHEQFCENINGVRVCAFIDIIVTIIRISILPTQKININNNLSRKKMLY